MPLPEIVELNPTRALRKGANAIYLDMANMPTRGHSPGVLIERPYSSGMRFMNGDTLLARITPCLENGKTAYVDCLPEGHIGWGSTEFIVLRPRPPIPTEYGYCLARLEAFREFAIQSMTGSSGRQRVQSGSLAHFRIAVAPEAVFARFGELVKPLFERALAATNEGRALKAMRDNLLPRLVNGEIRVNNCGISTVGRTE